MTNRSASSTNAKSNLVEGMLKPIDSIPKNMNTGTNAIAPVIAPVMRPAIAHHRRTTGVELRLRSRKATSPMIALEAIEA
jgi:hypothetical protein